MTPRKIWTMSNCYLEWEEDSAFHEPSGEKIGLRDRVRRWLDQTPDFGQKGEVVTSEKPKCFLDGASANSYLEEWEDESLFEALRPRSLSSSLLCCFQGFLPKPSRSHIKTVDTCQKQGSWSQWDKIDFFTSCD